MSKARGAGTGSARRRGGSGSPGSSSAPASPAARRPRCGLRPPGPTGGASGGEYGEQLDANGGGGAPLGPERGSLRREHLPGIRAQLRPGVPGIVPVAAAHEPGGSRAARPGGGRGAPAGTLSRAGFQPPALSRPRDRRGSALAPRVRGRPRIACGGVAPLRVRGAPSAERTSRVLTGKSGFALAPAILKLRLPEPSPGDLETKPNKTQPVPGRRSQKFGF